MNEKIGVVIVTYNRLELLKEAIQCVQRQEIAFEKIVIVNNCSTDGTTEYLKQYSCDNNFVIMNMKENLGGAGGFAIGIEEINKYNLDWCLIIDDDAMLDKSYTKNIMQFAELHPEVNACSGVVKTNNNITTVHRRRLTNKLLFIESEVKKEEYEQEYFRCDLATFCGLMIRGNIMKQIGIPNADYFIWYDDTEYCLRLKEFGGIYNVNLAELNHKTKEIKEKQNYFLRTNWKYYYGQRNRLDTARKHYGLLTTVTIYLEMIAFLGVSYLMLLFSKNRKKGKYNIFMLKSALKDAFYKKLGKNENFFLN